MLATFDLYNPRLQVMIIGVVKNRLDDYIGSQSAPAEDEPLAPVALTEDQSAFEADLEQRLNAKLDWHKARMARNHRIADGVRPVGENSQLQKTIEEDMAAQEELEELPPSQADTHQLTDKDPSDLEEDASSDLSAAPDDEDQDE